MAKSALKKLFALTSDGARTGIVDELELHLDRVQPPPAWHVSARPGSARTRQETGVPAMKYAIALSSVAALALLAGCSTYYDRGYYRARVYTAPVAYNATVYSTPGPYVATDA